MAATTGSIFDIHKTAIEEIINKNVEELLPSLDPIWRDTIATQIGVGNADQIGRDMLIHKIYTGSMTGVIEGAWNALYNDMPLYGDNSNYQSLGDKVFTRQPALAWPDPKDGPNPKPFRLTVPMRAMVASFMLTLGDLQAEATPAFITDVVSPTLRGFARNWAHTLCNYFYLSQNTSYKLAGVSSVSATSGSGPYFVTFSPDNYAIDRFEIGQRLDIYDSTGTTRQNEITSVRQNVVVVAVDHLENTVTIASPTTPSSWTGGVVANTDLLVYANSKTASSGFLGIAGMNSWIKTGGSSPDDQLLGAEAVGGGPGGASDGKINVDTHPEFKSFHKAVNGPLTEHKLRQYVQRFHAAKNKYGQYIDCLIASDGVWLAYEAQKIGREILDRTGRLSSINQEGSQEGFTFTFNGRTLKGYTSQYVESGTLYGIRKGGNNWKKYVPPDPAGVTKMDGMHPFVPFRFVANVLAGHGSNRLPYRNSAGRPTEASEFPGMMRMQLVPDQPAGLKLTGLTEDRIYSTAQ